MDSFFRSKVEDKVNFKRRLKKLVDDAYDNYIFVQYGLQHSYTIHVPKPIRCCLHSVTSGANNIVVQFLAGVNNRLRSWTEDSEQARARRSAGDGTLTYRILKIIHIPNHFMYVAACADLTLKSYGSHYHEQSSTELMYTALDLVYCEFLDVVLISGIGFMQVFGFRKGMNEVPVFLADIKLPSYKGDRRWIKQISLDSRNKEILAVSYEGVLFLGGESGQSLSCLKELENRHSMSLSAAVAYPNRNYVITGMWYLKSFFTSVFMLAVQTLVHCQMKYSCHFLLRLLIWSYASRWLACLQPLLSCHCGAERRGGGKAREATRWWVITMSLLLRLFSDSVTQIICSYLSLFLLASVAKYNNFLC